MKVSADNAPENCNNCIYKQNMSKHWDLNDYCFLNKKVQAGLFWIGIVH